MYKEESILSYFMFFIWATKSSEFAGNMEEKVKVYGGKGKKKEERKWFT